MFSLFRPCFTVSPPIILTDIICAPHGRHFLFCAQLAVCDWPPPTPGLCAPPSPPPAAADSGGNNVVAVENGEARPTGRRPASCKAGCARLQREATVAFPVRQELLLLRMVHVGRPPFRSIPCTLCTSSSMSVAPITDEVTAKEFCAGLDVLLSFKAGSAGCCLRNTNAHLLLAALPHTWR